MFDQMEFNRKVVDILDQLVQDQQRLRDGKALSNLRGVEAEIGKLVALMRAYEKPKGVDFSIGGHGHG